MTIRVWHFWPHRKGLGHIKATKSVALMLLAMVVPPTERLR